MWLADTSVKRPVFATMVIMALVVLGIVSYPSIGKIDPDSAPILFVIIFCHMVKFILTLHNKHNIASSFNYLLLV
jgi:hypothetical protein